MDKYYQVTDIAKRYGVTLGTVYSWIKMGRLKAMKLGKCFYIRESDIKDMEQSANENESAHSRKEELCET